MIRNLAEVKNKESAKVQSQMEAEHEVGTEDKIEAAP